MEVMSLYFIAALLATLALIPLIGACAKRVCLTDAPGGRKQHEGAIPLVGGITIFPVFMIGSYMIGLDMGVHWPLFAALSLVLIVGGLDDRFSISAKIKFAVQFAAAFLIVIPGGAVVRDLGGLLGGEHALLGLFAIPFSVFCVVLLINAVNLMDGLDGLAGGKSFVMFGWLLLACYMVGNWEGFGAIGMLMAALLGFLFYNMRRPYRAHAAVFLGDAGSMALGLTLAWFVINLSQGDAPALAPISVAWIVALPVIDACGQFCRRIKEGRHPFSPDRGHFHYYLVDSGLSIGRSVVVILLIGVIFGAIGYGGAALGIPEALLFASWLIYWALHMVISMKPELFKQWLARKIS